MTLGLFTEAVSEAAAFGIASLFIFSTAYLEYRAERLLGMVGSIAVGLSFVGGALVQLELLGSVGRYVVYALIGIAMVIGLYNIGSGITGNTDQESTQ